MADLCEESLVLQPDVDHTVKMCRRKVIFSPTEQEDHDIVALYIFCRVHGHEQLSSERVVYLDKEENWYGCTVHIVCPSCVPGAFDIEVPRRRFFNKLGKEENLKLVLHERMLTDHARTIETSIRGLLTDLLDYDAAKTHFKTASSEPSK